MIENGCIQHDNSLEKGLVSVVIPVYKVEDYIVKTLESIVNQTYSKLELILVDDGTPDNSVAVAEAFLSDKGIDWRFIHQQNSGLPTARNNGIKEAKGEWVICPDSDDYIAPQAIERMVKTAKELSVRCVFCGFKNVSETTIDARPVREGESKRIDLGKFRRLFLERRIIPLAPGMLLKRSVYDALQFDKDCPYDEDIHFLWRLFYEIDDIAYIDSDYYNYLIRGTSMVHTLKPKAYLATYQRYKEMTEELVRAFPNDKVAPLILPKFKLGGLHVLAKSCDYQEFKNTVSANGRKNEVSRLFFQRNIKLSLYAILFCISTRLFYLISK